VPFVTIKIFIDGLLEPLRDKIKDGPKPKTYLEAKRKVKDVVEDDDLTVKRQTNSMAGFEASGACTLT
jgi:hypothetical protein